MAQAISSRIRVLLAGMLLLLALLAGRTQDIGQQIEARGLDADYAANYRVEYIGQRVALAYELSDVHFAIFNDRELNAFALPDGRVYITSLMAHAVSDDELAFVIGHELTHIKERHARHQNERATGGAILGAIIAAVLGGGAEEIRMGADILGGLTLGHYSRDDERKADAGGLRMMARCGYDPRQAAVAMQRLVEKYGAGDASVPVLGWFATHPDTRTRRTRLQTDAETLLKSPPTVIAPPLGVAFALDPQAAHASAWVHNYFSIALTSESGGRALVTPALTLPAAPPAPAPPASTPLPAPALSAARSAAEKKDEKKVEPLPAVTLTVPAPAIAYHVTLNLQQVPAGRAPSLEKNEGVAVQATLQWSDVNTGFAGICTAGAQTRKNISWQAQDQVGAAALNQLSDGKQLNIEGTLEAAAVRRAARVFAEIVKAGGPVDHAVPVKVKLNDGKARPGDHVAVIADDRFVAEIAVDQVDGKNVTGTVLWGTHAYKKKDKFFLMEM